MIEWLQDFIGGELVVVLLFVVIYLGLRLGKEARP